MEEVIKLFVFSAPWCGQCKAYHPIIEKFKKDNPQVTVCEFDADKDEDITSKYEVKSLPTTILVDSEGNAIKRHHGIMTKVQLLEFIKV